MTDPTLPRADRIISGVLNGPDWEPGLPSRSGLTTTVLMRSMKSRGKPWPEEEISGWDQSILDALFACLPPGSEYVVIRRSDLAVMGLEPLGVDDSTRGLARSLGAEPGYRLVAPGSPVPEASDG